MSVVGNYFRERVQAELSKRDYTIVGLHRAAKMASMGGALHLAKVGRTTESATEREFCDFALSVCDQSYSQYHQEAFALWANHGMRDGTFTEFGAADGLTHSNTHMLEEQYGWAGLLIEPLPYAFEEARRRRPKAKVVQAAVDPDYAETSKTLEFVVAGQFSTISDYQDGDKHRATRSRRRKISVKTVNLNVELEKAFPAKVVNFMSIDVEGPESAIVLGLDFDKFDIRALAIEVNDRDADAETIRTFLSAKGFIEPFSPAVTRQDLWFCKR